METESANALLKILEEPPANCMFFLISHAPGRLLPTIRSRCRLVRFRALSVSLAEQVLALTLPDLDREERRLLAEAAQGSPGEAMRYAELDVPLMEQALTTIEAGGPNMLAERSALAKSLSGKNAQPRFELFLDYFPSRLARSVRTLTGDALAEGISLWERASDLANSARRISLDPESTVFELTASLAALTRFRNR
jgi:DNA polymerase-3 subunit delta'